MPRNPHVYALLNVWIFCDDIHRKAVSELIDCTIMYPKKCRKSIKRIVEEVGASIETAYAMLLMTALLMDLRPEDDEVVRIILQDCGIEDSD